MSYTLLLTIYNGFPNILVKMGNVRVEILENIAVLVVNVLEEAHSRFKEETMSGAGVWFAPSSHSLYHFPTRSRPKRLFSAMVAAKRLNHTTIHIVKNRIVFVF